MRLAAPMVLLLALCAPVLAQLDFRIEKGNAPEPIKIPPAPAPNLDGETQVLEFMDGSYLRGTLESLDEAGQELRWRLQLLPTSFPLALAAVRSLNFPGAASEVKTHSTAKFGNGDWLGMDVESFQDELRDLLAK